MKNLRLRNPARYRGFLLHDPVQGRRGTRWRAISLSPFRPDTPLIAVTRVGGQALTNHRSAAGDSPTHSSVLHNSQDMVVLEQHEGVTLAEIAHAHGGRLALEPALAVAMSVLDVVKQFSPRELPPLHPALIKMRWDGQIRLEGNFTTSGLAMGFGYMSLEQVRGAERDERSSAFAVGALLFWLATGQHPFGDGDDFQTLERVRTVDFEPEVLAASADRLCAYVITSCLCSTVEERVTSLDLLGNGIEHLANAGDEPAGLESLLEPFEQRRRCELAERAAFRELELSDVIDVPPLALAPLPPVDPEKKRMEAQKAIQETLEALRSSSVFDTLSRMERRMEQLEREAMETYQKLDR